MKEYETIKGTAERLGVSERTIRKLLKEYREWPGARLISDGRIIRIHFETFARWWEQRGAAA